MKRNYTHIKVLEMEIIELRETGKGRKEIAEELGLTEVQVKNWINRYNKRDSKLPKRRGRPRTRPLTSEEEKDKEIKRLKMENELLRDFLQLHGRR
jgi:transposase